MKIIAGISAIFTVVIALILFTLGIAGAQESLSACFTVTAYNDFGESGFSEVVCSVPEVLSIDSKITLAWNSSERATGYKMYYRDANDTTWMTPIDVGNNLTVTIPVCSIYCPEVVTGLSIQ